MESILRGSFVSLASKGYPNHCHTPNRDREKRNTHTSAWPDFPEAIDSCAVDRISPHAVVFTYRIHGTEASRIATPLQTFCGIATAFLPKLFEHEPSISQTLFQHYHLVVQDRLHFKLAPAALLVHRHNCCSRYGQEEPLPGHLFRNLHPHS
jgi:hypothetical protein